LKTKLYKGGAPSKVEISQMTKSQLEANVGTPMIENTKLAFNPCFVLLGLHVAVPKQSESDYCQKPRCKKHRHYHPSQKDETKLKFVKSWPVKSPRSSNIVEVAIYECPRCKKRCRKYPRRVDR